MNMVPSVLVQTPKKCPSIFSFESKGFEKCFRSFYMETFFKFFDGDGAAAILGIENQREPQNLWVTTHSRGTFGEILLL